MKNIFVASALAIATLSVSPVFAEPAAAQSRTGIAVADLERAIRVSTAMTTAGQQVQTTYKAQIDQYNSRATTLQAELDVLTARLREEAGKPTPNQTTLQTLNQERQTKSQAAQRELAQIEAPYALAISYAQEQVQLRLDEAVKAAMTGKRVDLLISPEAVIARENNADITDAVIAEINRIIPSVSIAVPQGYQPGQLIQAAARAAQGAAAPAAPAQTGSQPTTR